jgi:hypothetical protein
MVHALQEAWRVLRPKGMMIDLRPASRHGRVGLLQSSRFIPAAEMEENLQYYRDAGTALEEAKRQGWFEAGGQGHFDLITEFDSLESLRMWLYDFQDEAPHTNSDRLVKVVGDAMQALQAPAQVAAQVPFVLNVCRRLPAAP